MISSSVALNEINEKSELYDYWKDLPQIKMLTAEQYNKSKGVIRQSINRILSIGLEVAKPGRSDTLKRHALTAKEIRSLVEKRTNLTIGKSNLYFHLQELEKLGLIRVIDIAISNKGRGKKYSAYYGRTAKLFRFDHDVERMKEELDLLYRDEFVNFLKEMNPSIFDADILDVINGIKKINKVENDPFFNWLKKYEFILSRNNIDLNAFGRLIIFLHIYDPSVLDRISKLRKLMKYE
ncbi:MAG: hypothetical protein ACW99A_03955 [Candidatus Kariarchaeaceae archaeon]